VGVRVGRLVFEQYGRVMGERAQSAQRYLRRAWLLSVVICVAFALGGGWGLYAFIEPTFRDFRQQQVLTKSDLPEVKRALSAEIGQAFYAELTALRGELQEVRSRLRQQESSPAPAPRP
jgi:peptidoglycan/LPS O-acetylase OafA/YrhL